MQLPLVLFLSFNRLSAMKVTPEERGVNIPLAVLLIIQVSDGNGYPDLQDSSSNMHRIQVLCVNVLPT